MKRPRDYQLAAFDAIRDAFRQGKKRIIAELATGTGKGTIVALVCKMARDKGKRVLVIVNRDVLVTQLLDDVLAAGVHAYREQSSERAPITADCVVGSVQSMQGDWINKWREGYFDVVICDEVQFSTAKTFKRILERFPNSFHIGLTATAERHDKKSLWKGYEEIVYRFPLKSWTDKETGEITPGAIDEGWLVGFQFEELPVPIVLEDQIALGKKEMTDEEGDEFFDKSGYLPRLFHEASIAMRGTKGLAFLPGCKASEACAAAMRDNGLNARHIDGYMTKAQRAELLTWFAGVKRGVICNAQMLTFGYNQPDINCIGVFRLIRSTPDYKQILGRGTRTVAKVDACPTKEERLAAIASSSKPICRVIDLMIQNEDHNLATPSCLITDDKEEQKALNAVLKKGSVDMSKMDEDLSRIRIADAEKQLAKLASDAAQAAEKVRHKMREPYIKHITRIAGKPDWKPMSDAQLWKLRDVGYKGPIEGIYSFHARKIIDVYMRHKQAA